MAEGGAARAPHRPRGGGRGAGGGAGLAAGSAYVPRSQALMRCLGGRATLRGGVLGPQMHSSSSRWPASSSVCNKCWRRVVRASPQIWPVWQCAMPRPKHICDNKNRSASACLMWDGKVVTWGDASFGGDSASVQAQLTGVESIASIVYVVRLYTLDKKKWCRSS